MEAHDCSPQAPVTTGFNEGISVSESRASLIDRLVARLGHGAVLHETARVLAQPARRINIWPICPTWKIRAEGVHERRLHCPDREWEWGSPASDPAAGTSAPAGGGGTSARSSASPVHLASHNPQGHPRQWPGTNRTAMVGRRRGTRTRDYFRLQDESGVRASGFIAKVCRNGRGS